METVTYSVLLPYTGFMNELNCSELIMNLSVMGHECIHITHVCVYRPAFALLVLLLVYALLV